MASHPGPLADAATRLPAALPPGAQVPPLAAAEQLAARGELAAARHLVDDDMRRRGASGPALTLLAMLSVTAGRAEDAVREAEAALAHTPHDARAWLALGRGHKLAGRLPEAVAAYRRAIDCDPQRAEAHVSLGIALKHGGELEAAVACQERAVALQPTLAAAHANLAYAKAALSLAQAEAGVDDAPGDEVLRAARHAATLDPRNATLQFNLAMLLRQAQQRDAAIDAFNRALGLRPDDAGCCLQLGHELVVAGAGTTAITLYTRWLERNPPHPAVMRALSNQLAREGAAGASLQWAERAATLDADPAGHLQLCHTLQACRRLPEAMAAGQRAIDLSNRHWTSYPVPLLVASYLHESAAPVAALHAEFGRALAAATADAPPPRRRALPLPAGRRLRIGYVSPDFIHHSVAYFMGALLERHDRHRFEVWCYHNRAWGDAMTGSLRALGHHWVECAPLSDEALRRRIEADGIDILVDLAGHTAGARPRLFALGAAPLQLSYLGYPTASGVPRIAHRISDGVIDPGDMPDIGSERPLCLPRSMFCWRPPESPAIDGPPSLRRNGITFGSFNNHAKISDHCLDLWAQVLRAVPRSRLLLKSASVVDPLNRQDLVRFMAQRGVSQDRLDLRARTGSRQAHFETYREVDIALDPFPYNGATTTCEALWMGVPVVSRHGATHTARMGASILAAAGRPQWLADDDAGYLALAIEIAGDVAQRRQWRRTARGVLAASELMDEPGFVAAFEAGLLQAWAAAVADRGTDATP